ncbi:hypothetical protein PVAND_008303 [Polypedilum vanderplanki]|uniref:Uncharacterized protein n=1 Tax=Polypedilum vanderplanki TaxID=319348 RepID=A0A9J6C9K4_POLVA|nr:hypothetical protein PVAND_008303 [Polypedilum vanderplanki]
MQLFLILFLKLLIFHHGVVKVGAFPENIDGDTKELSFEYSNSMDEDDSGIETTTLENEMSIFEPNPPNQMMIHSTTTTVHTTTLTEVTSTLAPFTTTTLQQQFLTEQMSIHDLISQTSSPLLMKLIAPLESTAAEPTVINSTETETLIKTKKTNKNQIKQIESSDITRVEQYQFQQQKNDETPVVNIKKPRLLNTKSNPFKNNAESEINLTDDTTTIPDLDTENNETNIDIGEEITTVPSPSTSKRPSKNIEIFKTRPNELLRFYVEDSHLRSPIAALVNKKSNPLNKAKKLWKAALRPNSLLDIMVVSYDSEGIKSTYNLTNTKAMMTTLDKVREENATDQESKTYYSIIRTGQLIPFDSAIFLSTDELPNDTEHQLQASMFLLKKRIRLYLIMFDDKNLSMNETTVNISTATTSSSHSASTTHTLVKETGFLGQLALLTGGDIIYVPNHVFQNDGEMGYITLIRQNKLKAIDQEPVKDFQENELRNDTETFSAKEDSTLIH